MSRLAASDLVWILWLALFLVLELGAFFQVFPWDTLSSTSWLNEQRYPWLRTILLGFLIGLAIHIRFQTGLWRTSLGGIVVALVVNLLWLA